MDTLQAFHNDPAIKAKYLARVKWHREADNLIQGTGWENGRGCAIGCTLEAYEHELYPLVLGLPEWLAYLEDAIFEGLPVEDAMAWPERFLSAIRVGVTETDLERVKHRLAIRRMERLLTFTSDRDVVATIKMVRDRHALAVEGGSLGWSAVLEEVWSAMWSARLAAESASWSAASAARSAADSADSAVIAEALSSTLAAEAAWQREADNLIELLEAV